jgi:hypothetical protein
VAPSALAQGVAAICLTPLTPPPPPWQHERLAQHIGALQARGEYLRHAQLRPLLQRLRQSAVANNGGGGGAAALLGELGGWLDAASAAVELSLEQAHHAAAWLLHVSAR